jgi:hypothetical protein
MQAVIEGLGITLSKTFSPPPPSMPFQQPGMPGGPPDGMQGMQPMQGMPPPLPAGADMAAADGSSSSGGGGLWSWFTGSEEQKVCVMVAEGWKERAGCFICGSRCQRGQGMEAG